MNNNKEKYKKPKLTIIDLYITDIIRTSAYPPTPTPPSIIQKLDELNDVF